MIVTMAGQRFPFGFWDGRPILWRVLRVTDHRRNTALAVSEYGLCARKFCAGPGEPTWAGSDLRAWLNGDFLRLAFSPREQQAILPVTRRMRAYYNRPGKVTVTDRLWLPSRQEAEAYGLYITQAVHAKVLPASASPRYTRYGTRLSGRAPRIRRDDPDAVDWCIVEAAWLRSPAPRTKHATIAAYTGIRDAEPSGEYLVRPMMLLDLKRTGELSGKECKR